MKSFELGVGKGIVLALGILWAAIHLLSAQAGPNGTWQLQAPEGSPSFSVFLKMDGALLTGLVSRCATAQSQSTDIYDGHVTGDTLTFKCTSPDRDRTVSFTGRIVGEATRRMSPRRRNS